MSVAYAAPMYVGISVMLCLSYGCIEFTKEKGKLDTSNKLILFGWCIVSIIIASIIAGASSEIMVGMPNIAHLLIAALLAIVTLFIYSIMIYWS